MHMIIITTIIITMKQAINIITVFIHLLLSLTFSTQLLLNGSKLPGHSLTHVFSYSYVNKSAKLQLVMHAFLSLYKYL